MNDEYKKSFTVVHLCRYCHELTKQLLRKPAGTEDWLKNKHLLNCSNCGYFQIVKEEDVDLSTKQEIDYFEDLKITRKWEQLKTSPEYKAWEEKKSKEMDRIVKQTISNWNKTSNEQEVEENLAFTGALNYQPPMLGDVTPTEKDDEKKAFKEAPEEMEDKHKIPHRKSFEEGVDSSKLKSHKQALVRATLLAIITAISFYNSLPIFLKIIIFIVLFLILGAIGSSKKFRDKI